MTIRTSSPPVHPSCGACLHSRDRGLQFRRPGTRRPDDFLCVSSLRIGDASPLPIPDDQMSHVQVVTVQPTTLVRTLRLTGTVAYNAFQHHTGDHPGRRTRHPILSVPGQHVHEGEPMLEVSKPGLFAALDTYLKAADSSRLTETNYARAQDLYQHHAIALRDLQQAESDRNQARADLNAAEQGMRSWHQESRANSPRPGLRADPVLAPISGEVVERLVSPGQVVQAARPRPSPSPI